MDCKPTRSSSKKGEDHARILIENLPGDSTNGEVKALFKSMRGNVFVDLRGNKGRQAKDKLGAWTRACRAVIKCSEVSAALRAKQLYDGAVLRRGHRITVKVEHLHDDTWFWLNEEGEMDIYAINMSPYDSLSIVIQYDRRQYFPRFSAQFDRMTRRVDDGNAKITRITVVIPPNADIEDAIDGEKDFVRSLKLCTFKRRDYTPIDYESLDEKDIPSLVIYREVHILAEHDNDHHYLLPFALDHDLTDMVLSMDVLDRIDGDDGNQNGNHHRNEIRSVNELQQLQNRSDPISTTITKRTKSNIDPVPVLCSQGPRGTFSHSVGGYINSWDFACPIGTPVIAPRDGIITDLCTHHKKGGTDLSFEKKCNYVTILHEDGSQCDLVHLRYKSAQFSKGDVVRAGDLIAYSGNTGFSGEPHIHMMVYVNRLIRDSVHWQSVPITFRHLESGDSQNTLKSKDSMKKTQDPCTDLKDGIGSPSNPMTSALSTVSPLTPVPGQRYTNRLPSLYLDPLLIPSDRITVSPEVHPNWNEMDYTPNPNKSDVDVAGSRLTINQDLNKLIHFTVAELSTLQCDVIIVPLSRRYIMKHWLSCRVMRRGGTKLMAELMKKGYDLLHTVGLKTKRQHAVGLGHQDGGILVLPGYDQLPCKKVLFALTEDCSANQCNTLSAETVRKIFKFFRSHHDQVAARKQQPNTQWNHKKLSSLRMESVAVELPLFNGVEGSDGASQSESQRNAVLEQLRAIREGIEGHLEYVANHETMKRSMLKQWFICAQTLHDLHSHSECMATIFPRKPSISRSECAYIPHCPCDSCYHRQYGLGKLHQKMKVELHQKGIEQDSCSGVPDEFLHLNGVLHPGDVTPQSPSPTPPSPMSVVTSPLRDIRDGNDEMKDESGDDGDGGGSAVRSKRRKQRRKSSKKRHRKRSKSRVRRRHSHDHRDGESEIEDDDSFVDLSTSDDSPIYVSAASSYSDHAAGEKRSTLASGPRRSSKRKRSKRRRDGGSDHGDASWFDGDAADKSYGSRPHKKRKVPSDVPPLPAIPSLNGWPFTSNGTTIPTIPNLNSLQKNDAKTTPNKLNTVTFESIRAQYELVSKRITECTKRPNRSDEFIASTLTKKQGDHHCASSHLAALIAQQSQLDLHAQRCLIYQQFKRYVHCAQIHNAARSITASPFNQREMKQLQTLRTMQLNQQLDFQKSKKNDTMIIGEQHGVVGSKEHMDCIPLTPTVPVERNKVGYLIDNVAPKREYYAPSLQRGLSIGVQDCGFAEIALTERERQINLQIERLRHQQLEKERSRKVQKQIAMHQQQIRLRAQLQRQQEAVRKMQNVIEVIVNNGATLCGAAIRSAQHAVQHLSNCKSCIATLEKFRGTLF